MFEKLETVEKRYEELTKLISDPEVIAKQSEWQQYMKEHAEIADSKASNGWGRRNDARSRNERACWNGILW